MATLELQEVTFKTNLHCNGCMEKMKTSLSKIKGVQDVIFNKSKELVIVRGCNLEASGIERHMRKKHMKEIKIVSVKSRGISEPTRSETDQQIGDGDGDGDLRGTRYKKGDAYINLELLLFMIIAFVISLVLVNTVNK